MNGTEKPGFRYPFERETELAEAVCAGKQSTAGQILNELLGCIFFGANQQISTVRTRVFELLVILTRAAAAHGMEEEKVFACSERWLEEILQFDSVDELCIWLVDVVTQLIHSDDEADLEAAPGSVRAAEQYIRKNCANKLTLGSVAAHVYLSPSYFSRVFQEGTGMCFSEYLNRARVERAKRLMTVGGIAYGNKGRLAKVAGDCGFEDPSYFCKVFKRITGVTPKEFYTNYRHGKAFTTGWESEPFGGRKNDAD